ncbi:MAG: YggS family pyridoxal phosphate-dependent enzyme [Candidatus Omnitrophica bacterium]|nr:YggS family pyridoxal phosphate-dependent enzyme [Candidatus Omnitrophota bacterium]
MIFENYQRLRNSIPEYVDLVVAAKQRLVKEIEEVINAGAQIIGENYLQETQELYNALGKKAKALKWHMIGHLQRNKVKQAVEIFDMIQTVDSLRIAQEINKRCSEIKKLMPVLVEINSAREAQKTGLIPEEALDFIKEISTLPFLKIMGIMTMGPRFGNPEKARSYFIKTKRVFEELNSLSLPNVVPRILSMGMTNTFRVAIEEGSNMVRIGQAIFQAG